MEGILTITQAYIVLAAIALLLALKLTQVVRGVRRGGDIVQVAFNATAFGFLLALLIVAVLFLPLNLLPL